MTIIFLIIGYSIGVITGIYVGMSMAKEFRQREDLAEKKTKK